jgi:ribosomal protein S18 acetylase RimI-like enzyme
MLLRPRGCEPRAVSLRQAIRQATASDVERIEELVESAYGKWVPILGLRPAPMDADYAALLQGGDPGTDVFVLADPQVIGVLVIAPEGDDALMVENVAVDPEQQGRGIGPALLEFAEDQARSRGLSELRLYTHELMASNLDLYERLGWQEYERRKTGDFARVFMRKPVSASPAGGQGTR